MTELIPGLSIAVAVVAVVMAFLAFSRTARLSEQIVSLRRELQLMDDDLAVVERRVKVHHRVPPPSEKPAIEDEVEVLETPPTNTPKVARPVTKRRRPPAPTPIDWEKFVGRRVLGWVAVGLLVLAATFFIKYAFDTIFGPTARVAIGALVGIGLCLIGGRFGHRGKSLVCAMICSAGLLVLYLSIYVAFGYYTLLQPLVGGAFLAVIVTEGVLLSIWYRAKPLAYLALAGALLVPILVPADEDRYLGFFLYLMVVNAAAAVLLRYVAHPGLRLLTYLGSQLLFWIWFSFHYHPEKLGAVIAVQTGLYAVWLLVGRFTLAKTEIAERIAMWLATALCFFLALHRIVNEEATEWRGVLALGFALWYAVLARAALPAAAKDITRLATLTALAFGFLGVAIPLHADAPWTPVGWAVIGTVLWWFGLRVRQDFLRFGGLLYLSGSLVALLWAWTIVQPDSILFPFFNPRSLPIIAVAGCLLRVAWLAHRYQNRQSELNTGVRYAAGLGAVGLVWVMLTWETLHTGRDIFEFSELGSQTALSIVWAIYAATLLAIGFSLSNPPVRWTGLGLLVITVLKLITYDLSELPEIYRALTFLAVAIVTAAAAWGYHRITHTEKEANHE